MQPSREKKRAIRRRLMEAHRAISKVIAIYQTPDLFSEPMDSKVARKRAVGFFPKVQTVWSDPNAFENAPHIPKGIHSVWYQGLPIDFELTRKTSDTLLVVFHGALDRDADLPIFSGAQIASGLDVARLSFNDPSLYLSSELPLAWHAGNEHQPDLQSVTTRLIKKVAASVGARRIILFGSSGGGFASLIQAAALPQATAVVANAQTNALLYHQVHVQKYLTLAWGGNRDAFIEAGGNSAVDCFRALDAIPRVLYLQNSTDTFHIRDHLIPFVRGFAANPNMSVLLGNWGQGHIAPPKELFHRTLKAVAEKDEASIQAIGFQSATAYNLW